MPLERANLAQMGIMKRMADTEAGAIRAVAVKALASAQTMAYQYGSNNILSICKLIVTGLSVKERSL